VALRGALSRGSFDHHYEADVFYDGERRLTNIPVMGVRWSEDGDAQVQVSGSLTVVWTDTWARSISPQEVTDTLAPFGAEIQLYSVITAGPFSERVSLGRFEITEVPSAVDEDMLFRGEWFTMGSVVELEFKERLAGVGEERFDVPTAPSALGSTWDEVGRITQLQLRRTVSDAVITRATLYEESKLDALYNLMDLFLAAIPHMTEDGALAARPLVWPEPVWTLRRGDGGEIVSIGRSMSAARVYNRVAVRGKAGDQTTILATSEIASGPLRVSNPDGAPSPFRKRTYFLSSDMVTTAAQAKAWADRTLPEVSSTRSLIVPVVCTFNPLLERGDVVVLERAREYLTGRIVSIDRSDRATQSMSVEVRRG
jgi:hypothetical protein